MLFILSLTVWCVCADQRSFSSVRLTCEDFGSVSHRLADSIASAMNQNDFPLALSLVEGWISRYGRLSAPKQDKYKHFLINAYYIKTCIYSEELDTGNAIRSFSSAVREGYKDYHLASSDPNLRPLRANPEFRSLMRAVQERGDYLYILRNSGPYYNHERELLPKFVYPSPSARDLVKLRARWRLDSVAGNGSETSKIIRLLSWAHDIIPHDGTRAEPEITSAVDLIGLCKKERRGLDCRGLAVVLNDAYLAIGLKSRVVTCMPKDTADREHHVITAVYSNSLAKWLWMDPTNNAYITDEKGGFLGIDEVRQRMISADSLRINADANWNHKTAIHADKYIYEYMAKNLYWLQCSFASGYTKKSAVLINKGIDYIALFPADYTPYGNSTIKLVGGTAYITSDPAYFWQKPPQ